MSLRPLSPTARQDLERYTEQSGDKNHLQSCLQQLQQIHSTLKMLQQSGALLLTGEMLTLLGDMAQLSPENAQEHQILLMQGMLQLPGYLDHTSRSGQDKPALIRSLINEMRQLRGESSLNEADFFSPDISESIESLDQEQLENLKKSGFSPLVRKIRQKYQLCLAGVLRNKDKEKQLELITRIFAKLQNLCWGSPLSPLWDAGTALAQGLREGSISLNADTIALLRNIDRQLKTLVSMDVDGVNSHPDHDLLRNILYQLAIIETDNSLIVTLKQRYNLDEALQAAPDDDKNEQLFSLEAAVPVVQSINEELARIKDVLDLFLLNPEDHRDSLTELLPVIQQLGDVLTVLELDDLRTQILAQQEKIQSVLDHPDTREEILIDVASNLLQIEAALSHYINGNHPVSDDEYTNILDDIHLTVIHEARKNLDQSKECVVDYLENHKNLDFLEKIPSLMHSIQGGLAIIPLNRAAELIEQCAQYLQNTWLTGSIRPEREDLEHLADAISSIDYYLERLVAGDSRVANILNVTDESLSLLQQAAPKHLELSELNTDESVITDEFSTDGMTFELNEPFELSTEELEFPEEIDVDPNTIQFTPTGLLSSEEITEDLSAPTEFQVETVEFELPDDFLIESEFNAEAIDVISEDAIKKAVTEAGQTEDLPPPMSSSIIVEEHDDDDLIDIFTEEANEVYSQLKEDYPLWLNNTEQKQLLTDIRRAFHTLKGSGRMVEANVVAELAWSIENLLNRVVEGSINLNDDMNDRLSGLLEDTINMLPELISDFASDNQQLTPEVLLRMEMADAFSKGDDFTSEEPPEVEEDNNLAMLHGKAVVSESIQDANLPESSGIDDSEGYELDLNPDETASDSPYDLQLLNIFENEAKGHLATIKAFIADFHYHGARTQISDQVQRALHTLKGSAYMAEITALAELISAIEKTIKEFRAHLVPADDQVISMLEQGIDHIETGLQQLKTPPHHLQLNINSFLNWLQALHDKMMTIVLSEEQSTDTSNTSQQSTLLVISDLNLLPDASQFLDNWHDAIPLDELDRFKYELKVLAESASEAKLHSISELCDVLLDVCIYLDKHETTLPEPLVTPLKDGFEALVDMMSQVAGQQTPSSPQIVFSAIREALETLLLNHQVEDSSSFASFEDDSQITSDFILDDLDEEEIVLEAPSPLNSEAETTLDSGISDQPLTDIPSGTMHAVPSSIVDNEKEQDLVNLFLEESFELVEDCSITLELWLKDKKNLQPIIDLQRYLHTLKGGAQMTEMTELGELSHGLEDVYQVIAAHQRAP